MVLYGTNCKKFFVKRSSIQPPQRPAPKRDPADPKRARLLSAALAAFQELGPGASTLEIATRAKVSKRELYTFFSDKHDLLIACIAERTTRMRFALETPASFDRGSVRDALVGFGTALLRGVSDESTLSVFRLAIAESENSPEIARMLDSAGRETNIKALTEFLKQAQKSGQIVPGNPEALAMLFFAMLWGDLMLRLIMRVVAPPTPKEIARRARLATEALLKPDS
jgi:AcrR family transcriptional regulator